MSNISMSHQRVLGIGVIVLVFIGAVIVGMMSHIRVHTMKEYQSDLILKDLFPACTEVEVNRLETDLMCTLPVDYRQFLLAHNGVIFRDACFAHGDSDKSDPDSFGKITTLFGVYYAQPTFEHLVDAQLHLEYNRRVPSGIVAIGYNGYQERICLSVAGDDKGAVYLWSPGVPFEEGRNVQTRKYLHLVASSFREFWNSLFRGP